MLCESSLSSLVLEEHCKRRPGTCKLIGLSALSWDSESVSVWRVRPVNLHLLSKLGGSEGKVNLAVRGLPLDGVLNACKQGKMAGRVVIIINNARAAETFETAGRERESVSCMPTEAHDRTDECP
jgi:hypothetical protein